MSVFNFKISNDKNIINNYNKIQFGEVITPFSLIEKIINLLPSEVFSNPKLTWLDPCVGTGNFLIILYKKLFNSLKNITKEPEKRDKHIITKMLHMVEINPEYSSLLKSIFGENSNIKIANFLELDNKKNQKKHDIIIGNPPFNSGGSIKVPTNNKLSKKTDGKSIWTDFIINSINILNDNGYIAMITPSIWMKRDHKMFNFIRANGKILKLHTLTNTETNTIFNKQAQTPTCFWLFQKNSNKKNQINEVNIWDKINNKYVLFNKNLSIPLKYPSIISKLLRYTQEYGHILVTKTNMPSTKRDFEIKDTLTDMHKYKNIRSCVLNKLKPELVVNYSNKPCCFYDKEKLVLAHKMYGFPYYDEKGEYGISNRDNYVIVGYTKKEFERLKQFLSLNLSLLVFETTRYRMKYLERYAFEFMPDITKIPDFPDVITDNTVSDYFNFTQQERLAIKNITKKEYFISFN